MNQNHRQNIEGKACRVLAFLLAGVVLLLVLSALAEAEDPRYQAFFLDGQGVIAKLYDGLVMEGVRLETQVDGFVFSSDNEENNKSTILHREEDSLYLSILTDKSIRDPESVFQRISMHCSYPYNVDKDIAFEFEQINMDGKPVFFVSIFDYTDDEGINVSIQITEEEAQRGFAELYELEPDLQVKANRFLDFCESIGENHPELAAAIDETRALVKASTIVRAREKADAVLFAFEEAYINSLLDGFVQDRYEIIDGYIWVDEGSDPRNYILLGDAERDLYIAIETDDEVGKSDRKVIEVRFYGIDHEEAEFYGCAQQYTYDTKENRTTENIIFISPLENEVDELIATNIALSDGEFEKGIALLNKTDEADRREAFDAYFEEMSQKYGAP